MNRLKKLAIAATTALALTLCVSVASASAGAFESYDPANGAGVYPATLEASSASMQFGFDKSLTLSCGADLEGELPGRRTQATTSLPSTCSGVDMNGCELTFHPGDESAGEFAGTFDIGGAGCTAIDVKAGYNCELTIPAQSGLDASFENLGGTTPEARFSLETSSLAYTGVAGGLTCPKGSYSNGKLYADWEVGSFNSKGTQVGLRATDADGLYVEGGDFQAETYALGVTGEQGTQHVFKASAAQTVAVRCDSVHFFGTVWAASSFLPVGVEHSGCTASEVHPTTVEMNSCLLAFNVQSAEAPYAGSLDVVCETSGDAIVIEIYSETGALRCTEKIPAQEGLEGVVYSTIGEGNDRAVEVDLEVTGIDTTTEGGLLKCGIGNGAHSNGTYTGTSILEGMFGEA